MKKNFCLLVFSVLVSLFVLAQPAPKVEPAGPQHLDGYTKTTYPTTVDESLNQVTKVEIKNESGVVKFRLTYKKDITNKWTIVEEYGTSSKCSTTYQFDQENKLIRQETTTAGKTAKYKRNLDGALVLESDPRSENDIEPMTVKSTEQYLERTIKEIEENVSPSLGYLKSPCSEPGSNCQTQFAIFVGPSALISDFGKSSETFFGGHGSITYNLGKHFAIGADLSHYSKKFGTENLNRSFILAEVRYDNFLGDDTRACDEKRINAYFKILAGLAFEKYGTSKGSGFTFGAGAAGNYMVTQRFGVVLQGDFLGIKFNDTDELNSNWRATIGAVLKFQRENH